MAFTVETGAGLTDSNTYASVETFLAYWQERGKDYSDQEPEALQAALIKATDYIELAYAFKWRGRRLLVDQALSWPRRGAADRDGALFAEDALPARLVKAVNEYAARALVADLLPDPTIDPNVKKTSVSVGPLTESIEYAGTATMTKLKPYPMADKWLDDLTIVGGVIR